MKPKYVIIAPHADDEIIGCYELLVTGKVDTVAFPNNDIIEEAIENLKEATELYLEEFQIKESSPPILTSFDVPAHA